MRRTLELGGVVQLDEDLPTLAEWVETWWRLHAMPNLAANTRTTYGRTWDKHIRPRIGHLRLRAITPAVIDLQVVEPMRRGGVGVPTIRMGLAMLQSVMRLAVVHHDALATNPVALVRRPKTQRRDTVPVWPTAVEAIRARLPHRDATMVSVLAYAGLRPEELLALQWRDLRAESLVVERAVTHGQVGRTKTGADRQVRLLRPLALDLAEWRMASGRPAPKTLVFPRPDGRPWLDTDWRNWRARVYQPLARAVGLADARPYALRASFVSLLIQEGRTVVEVADQAGHTPETCLRHYARLFRDAPPVRLPAETAIQAARGVLGRGADASGGV